jgi:hypothetical protein
VLHSSRPAVYTERIPEAAAWIRIGKKCERDLRRSHPFVGLVVQPHDAAGETLHLDVDRGGLLEPGNGVHGGTLLGRAVGDHEQALPPHDDCLRKLTLGPLEALREFVGVEQVEGRDVTRPDARQRVLA